MSNNSYTGSISNIVTNLESITELYLDNNKFSGPIPESIRNLKIITYLDMSNNELTGPIPESLSELGNLRYLYINDNNLTGMLPKSLNNMESLNYIELSDNPNLYGYTIENKNIDYCDYRGTNICYISSGYCHYGAPKCTQEQIDLIENNVYWATKLGYSCCDPEDSNMTYFKDSDGEWGINSNNEWCGIIRDGSIQYKCEAEKYGYKCCSDASSYVLTDEQGEWGVENNEWCGIIKEEPNTPICDEEKFGKLGYKCCSKPSDFIVKTDEIGNWGVENGYWCGL